jgi:hypothetical protein
MSDDLNNSSLNNLFGHFLNVEAEANVTYDFDNVDNMICIDTSNHRIGINTLDPTCSLDISGDHGKINVNTISCETLDVSGINVYEKISQLDTSINNNLIANNLNASFSNIDISGTLDLSSNRGRLNIIHIDNSGDLKPGELYYDLSGFVKIKLNLVTGTII